MRTRIGPAKDVAAEYGISRESLYKWKYQLLNKERVYRMSKKESTKKAESSTLEEEVSELQAEKDNLSSQVTILQREVHR